MRLTGGYLHRCFDMDRSPYLMGMEFWKWQVSTTQNPGQQQYNSPGNYLVSFEACNAGGCNTDYLLIEVLADPWFAACNEDLALCQGTGQQTGLGGGLPVGGSYSGMGVTDDGNGLTYSFDPTSAGLSSHQITYTVNNGTCMGSTDITIEVVGSDQNAWIGPAIGNWNDTHANWSRGFVPLACDDVLIPVGKVVTLVSGKTAICRTLEVQVGGEIKTELTAILNVLNPE